MRTSCKNNLDTKLKPNTNNSIPQHQFPRTNNNNNGDGRESAKAINTPHPILCNFPWLCTWYSEQNISAS